MKAPPEPYISTIGLPSKSALGGGQGPGPALLRQVARPLWAKVCLGSQAILRAGASFDRWQLGDSWLGLEMQLAATGESTANGIT